MAKKNNQPAATGEWKPTLQDKLKISESITWINAKHEIPDADISVLIFDWFGEIAFGYMDEDGWNYDSGAAAVVQFWAEVNGPS